MFGWGKRRKEFTDLFTRHVRPELVEAMQSPTFSPELNNFSTVRINFIAVAVQGESPNETGRRLGIVADATKSAGWYTDYYFANLAVLIDGPALPKAPSRSGRLTLLTELEQKLGAAIKSVHGELETPWGHYGSSNRATFGAMLPGFLEIISILHSLPYGKHVAR
jgi:hypothetical protein